MCSVCAEAKNTILAIFLVTNQYGKFSVQFVDNQYFFITCIVWIRFSDYFRLLWNYQLRKVSSQGIGGDGGLVLEGEGDFLSGCDPGDGVGWALDILLDDELGLGVNEGVKLLAVALYKVLIYVESRLL